MRKNVSDGHINDILNLPYNEKESSLLVNHSHCQQNPAKNSTSNTQHLHLAIGL